MSSPTLHPVSIPYDVTIGPADYVSARRLSLAPRPSMRLILWLWAMVFVPVCLWLTYFGWVRGRWHPLLSPIFGAALFLLFYFFVLLPWSTYRAYQRHHVTGELSEEGLKLTMEGASQRIKWPLIRKGKRSDTLLLFYFADEGFAVIPLRAFATHDDRAAALSLIERKVGEEEQ